MATRLYKCYGKCNEKYPKEDLVLHENGKRYCKQCLDNFIKEAEDREELYRTIQSLYSISFPTGMMLRQIKQYKEERKYTYKGMTLTLNYCKDNGLEFSPRMGVGIIPHQYERAKLNYLEKKKKEEQHIDIDLTPKIIKIPKLSKENLLRKEKLINLEDLL